jgi:hypothetical protein
VKPSDSWTEVLKKVIFFIFTSSILLNAPRGLVNQFFLIFRLLVFENQDQIKTCLQQIDLGNLNQVTKSV